jgi:hypothetical protein
MFDWRDLLSLAESLALQPEEAARRAAISRAYYAVFHQAKALVEAREGPLSLSVDSHERVWRDLERKGRGLARIGQDGRRFKRLRVAADYEVALPRLDQQLQEALALARSLDERIAKEQAAPPPAG